MPINLLAEENAKPSNKINLLAEDNASQTSTPQASQNPLQIIMSLINQAKENTQPARQAIAGALTGAENLGRVVAPYTNPGAGNVINQMPAHDFHQMLGVEKPESLFSLPGVEEAAGEAATFPFAAPERLVTSAASKFLPNILARLAGRTASGATFGAVNTPENRVEGAITGALTGAVLPPIARGFAKVAEAPFKLAELGKKAFMDMKPLEKEAFIKSQEAEHAKAEYETAQNAAQAQGIGRTPGAATHDLNQTGQKLQNINSQLNEMANTLPLNKEESALNVHKAEILHNEAQNALPLVEEKLNRELLQGQPHDVQAAAQIRAVQEARHKEIGQGYNALEQEFENKNVNIDNSGKIQNKTDELLSLIKKNEGRSAEATQVLRDLESLKENKPLNASEYLRAYRAASQFAREARAQAYKPGMNAEERHDWMQRYKELDDKVEEMGKTLEDSVGSQDFGTLKELNSRWKNEVVPLYRNTVYQNIRKFGRMPDNIIKSLRGTEPGNVIIRDIIQSNPEISRNVVAQRFKASPKSIHQPDLETQNYINQVPGLRETLGQHTAIGNQAEIAAQSLKDIRGTHEEISKNSDKYLAERHKFDTHKQNYDTISKVADDLRRKLENKNMSLKEAMMTKKALAQAESSKSKAQKALIASAVILFGFRGGMYLANKLSTIGSAISDLQQPGVE